MTQFAAFIRRARWLNRTTELVNSVTLLGPVSEFVPGPAGRVLRVLSSLDSRFANSVLRFSMSGWESYYSHWVKAMARDKHMYTIGENDWVVGDFGGIPVVWSASWSNAWLWCPLSLPDLLAHAHQGGPAIVTEGSDNEILLRPDSTAVPARRSQVALDAIAKTHAIPGCRSWLFVGPPGSGKTTIARQLAAEFGEGSWIQLGPGVACKPVAWELVHALEPSAIVIDDLDASPGAKSDVDLRDGLATARTYAKVIVGTANTLEAVRGSLIRPGRFDEGPVVVSEIEAEVALEIGYALTPPILSRALEAKLLAAYLHELNLRVLAGRDPERELADLVARMEAAGDR